MKGTLGRVAGGLRRQWNRAALAARTFRLRHHRFPPLPAVPSTPRASGPLPTAVDTGQSLNLYGLLSKQLGLGESARLYARAFAAHGIGVTLHDIPLATPHVRMQWEVPGCSVDQPLRDADLVCVNPDIWSAVKPLIPARPELRLASWFWELETLPRAWFDAVGDFDGIVVATDFVGNAVRESCGARVHKVGLPLYVGPDSGLQRDAFGLREDAFVFLVSFDFFSSMSRKNPLASIAAFLRAFGNTPADVQLVIKTGHGEQNHVAFQMLLAAAGKDPRILVRNGPLAAAHWGALQRCCDCYVSLHRAEGFGLGMAECMARGKPVIATGWSGNLEFQDADSALLVEHRMVQVGRSDYSGGEGLRWADPSVDDAAAKMRWVYEHRTEAQALAERGRAKVAKVLSPAAVALQMRAALGGALA